MMYSPEKNLFFQKKTKKKKKREHREKGCAPLEIPVFFAFIRNNPDCLSIPKRLVLRISRILSPKFALYDWNHERDIVLFTTKQNSQVEKKNEAMYI